MTELQRLKQLILKELDMIQSNAEAGMREGYDELHKYTRQSGVCSGVSMMKSRVDDIFNDYLDDDED